MLRTTSLVSVDINHSLKVTVPMMLTGKSNGIPFVERGSPSVAESTSFRADGVDMGKSIFHELSLYLRSKRKRYHFVHF
jgi:hypothetical protein